MNAPTRPIAFSPSNPETQPFWDAARAGRFMLRRCATCNRAHWYPRAICPHCFTPDTVWVEASGRGVVYSFSVMRRAPVPYVIAYVTLEEGPTMVTNIVDCALDEVRIGMPVTLVWKASEGGPPMPMFTPR